MTPKVLRLSKKLGSWFLQASMEPTEKWVRFSGAQEI
jgi:hypothetical protein